MKYKCSYSNRNDFSGLEIRTDSPNTKPLRFNDGVGFLQRNTLFNLLNKLDDIIGKQLWLFKSSKMSTPRHLRKLHYVNKSFVSKRCWYSEKLVRKISKTCGNCDGNPSKTNKNKGTVNQKFQNNDKECNHLYKRKARVTNLTILIEYYVYNTKCLPHANQNSPCDTINKAG